MKKRAYNRVDTSKMTRKQLAAYRKRLASVRKYVTEKRKRQKEMRLKGITSQPSTTPFQLAQMKRSMKNFKDQNIDISKMQRLINELQTAVKKEEERIENRKRISTILEEIEELNVA